MKRTIDIIAGILIFVMMALMVACNKQQLNSNVISSNSCAATITIHPFNVGPDTMVHLMVGPDTMTVTKKDCTMIARSTFVMVGPETMWVNPYYSVVFEKK